MVAQIVQFLDKHQVEPDGLLYGALLVRCSCGVAEMTCLAWNEHLAAVLAADGGWVRQEHCAILACPHPYDVLRQEDCHNRPLMGQGTPWPWHTFTPPAPTGARTSATSGRAA